AMQRFYIERKHGVDGHAAVDAPLFVELRKALAAHKLGPLAAPVGEELLATWDLEHGLWKGEPVTLATIDALHAAGDEKSLRRFAVPRGARRRRPRRGGAHEGGALAARARRSSADARLARDRQGADARRARTPERVAADGDAARLRRRSPRALGAARGQAAWRALPRGAGDLAA